MPINPCCCGGGGEVIPGCYDACSNPLYTSSRIYIDPSELPVPTVRTLTDSALQADLGTPVNDALAEFAGWLDWDPVSEQFLWQSETWEVAYIDGLEYNRLRVSIYVPCGISQVIIDVRGWDSAVSGENPTWPLTSNWTAEYASIIAYMFILPDPLGAAYPTPTILNTATHPTCDVLTGPLWFYLGPGSNQTYWTLSSNSGATATVSY